MENKKRRNFKMKKMTNTISKVLTAALTGFIFLMPLYTCCFFLHQPKMPAEFDDFRKYDK